MKNFLILLAICCLPPLAVIAHDCWYAAAQKDPESFIYHFRLSDVGWLWLTYHRPSFEAFQDSIDPQTWSMWLEPVLRTRALLVSCVPLGLLLVCEVITRIFKGLGISLLRGKGKAPDPYNFGQKKNTPMKYKRK